MKAGKAILILIWLLVLAVFAVSAYQVITYTLDRSASRRMQDELAEQVVRVNTGTEEPEATAQPASDGDGAAQEPTEKPTARPEPTASPEPAEDGTEAPVPTGTPSPEQPAGTPETPTETPTQAPTAPVLMETAPIEVDFETLVERYSAVRAWIYLEDTPINYAVAQSGDNSYYLDHLLGGQVNKSGTLFMDCKNAADFSDWNTIIYGHNMKNGSMFGFLPRYNTQEFYEEHPAFYLLTPDKAYKAEVFAGYVTKPDSEAYLIAQTVEERDDVIREALEQSTFTADVEIGPQDRIVTLSTCTYVYDDARYVLLGVLRELAPEEDLAE